MFKLGNKIYASSVHFECITPTCVISRKVLIREKCLHERW